MSRLAQKLDRIEPLIAARQGEVKEIVYGVVNSINADGTPNFIRKWKGVIGNMTPTDEEPVAYIIEALEPLILKHKKYKGAYGGRAGTKSIMAMDAMAGDVNNNGSKVFCLREHMKALKNSIYAGIKSRINTLKLSGFTPVPSHWEIRHNSGGLISFGGMQNIRDIKSSFDYKYILLEEADRTSQETLDTLGPTLRGVEGAEMWFIWNPASSSDPMSKEFIIPFQEDLDRQGYYEDDYHLIIKVGHESNPWFQHDQSLRTEYEKDKEKMENNRMSKARFNHIWNGAFNDDVENCLIETDWFDACVDAHVKLGIKPTGAKVATFDPADGGKNDNMPITIRQGIVFYHMEELIAANGNDGFDMACGIAHQHNVDVFGWDCDGMGALLRNQATENFKGTKIKTFMFKGSESVHLPEVIFEASKEYGIADSKANKDLFRNKRAQNYVDIAERCRKTYEAVEHGVYHNPDDLISFSSESGCIQKLRSELCRLPIKPSHIGKIELYSKEEMKKGILMPDGSRLKLPSPGLADDVMMSFDRSGIITPNKPKRLPPSKGSWGRR